MIVGRRGSAVVGVHRFGERLLVFALGGNDDPIDEDARHANMLRRQRLVEQSLDLRDDDSA